MHELYFVLFKRQFNPRQNTTQQQQTTSQPVRSYEQPAAPTVHKNILQALPAATNVPAQYENDGVSNYGTGDLIRRSKNPLNHGQY